MAGGLFYVRQDASAVTAESETYLEKLPQLQGDAVTHVETVFITPDLLKRLMAQDIAAAQPYLDYLGATESPAAAEHAAAAIRSYYIGRMRDMAARNLQTEILHVPVATVGGRLRFSTVSFDGYFNVKDPVSLLFYGNAKVDSIYDTLTNRPPCPGPACSIGTFLDQDGPPLPDRARTCRSQTQWVLIGGLGEPLDWKMNSKGLMWGEGGCASGIRNHVRLFGDLRDSQLGSWVIATPHQEDWRNGGHVVLNWQEPLSSLVDAWSSLSGGGSSPRGPNDKAVRSWAYCRVNSEGRYQDVPFDGRAVIVAVP